MRQTPTNPLIVRQLSDLWDSARREGQAGPSVTLTLRAGGRQVSGVLREGVYEDWQYGRFVAVAYLVTADGKRVTVDVGDVMVIEVNPEPASDGYTITPDGTLRWRAGMVDWEPVPKT